MHFRTSQVVQLVKNPPASVGDIRDVGLIPGSGRSPEKRNGYPLQYSCLENSRDRGACRKESDTTERLTLSHFTSLKITDD